MNGFERNRKGIAQDLNKEGQMLTTSSKFRYNTYKYNR